MAKFRKLLISFLFLGSIAGSSVVGAQQATQLDTGSLKEKFDYMVNESNRYQQFKVVPQVWLNNFWTHVADTLRQKDLKLAEYDNTIEEQQASIADLNATAVSLNNRINELEQAKDSMSFLGIRMHKNVYNTVMWALVALLLAGLIIYILRFQHANKTTVETRNKNLELEKELNDQRKRMLEKEQVLRRQLQDEINKNSGR